MSDDLFERVLLLLDEGSFTATDDLLGDDFDHLFEKWHSEGRFKGKEDILAEAFSCAAFVGRNGTVKYLLEQGEDPNGGSKTGVDALHWAANRGKPETVRILVENGADLKTINMYGGNVFGQTLWCAIHEPREGQIRSAEILIDAGAGVEPGTLEWWNEQDLDPAIKERVAKLMSR